MRKLSLVGSLFVALSLWAASSLPVFGQTGGTVPTTVTVPAAICVTVDTTPIAYGSLAFSGVTNTVGFGNVQNVGSCSTVNQTLSVAGTDASGDLGAAWTLVTAGSCPGLGPDQFKHRVTNIDIGGLLSLSTTATPIATLSPDEDTGLIPTEFVMPCTGSDGSGETISTSIVFTATLQ